MDIEPFHFMRQHLYGIQSTYGSPYTSNILLAFKHDREVDRAFTDVVIRLQSNETIPVHSAILSLYSDIFTSMLSIGMIESTTRTIDWSMYDLQCVMDIVDYMYTGTITITDDNFIDLIEFTNYHRFELLLAHLISLITVSVTLDNIRVMHRIAYMLCNYTLITKVLSVISKYLELFISDELLLSLAPIDFMRVMEHKSCAKTDMHGYRNYDRLRYHYQVRAIVSYVSHDTSNRLNVLSDAITRIPGLGLISVVDKTSVILSVPESSPVRTKLVTCLKVAESWSAGMRYTSSSTIKDVVIFNVHNYARGDLIYMFSDRDMHDTTSNYGYVTGLKLYMLNTSVSKAKLAAVDIYYHTSKKIRLGIYPSEHVTVHDIRLEPGERFVDIKVLRKGTRIYYIKLYTNFGKKYGPYGKKYVHGLHTVSLLPRQCELNMYLYAINVSYDNVRSIDYFRTHFHLYDYYHIMFKWIY